MCSFVYFLRSLIFYFCLRSKFVAFCGLFSMGEGVFGKFLGRWLLEFLFGCA